MLRKPESDEIWLFHHKALHYCCFFTTLALNIWWNKLPIFYLANFDLSNGSNAIFPSYIFITFSSLSVFPTWILSMNIMGMFDESLVLELLKVENLKQLTVGNWKVVTSWLQPFPQINISQLIVWKVGNTGSYLRISNMHVCILHRSTSMHFIISLQLSALQSKYLMVQVSSSIHQAVWSSEVNNTYCT